MSDGGGGRGAAKTSLWERCNGSQRRGRGGGAGVIGQRGVWGGDTNAS